MKKLLLAFILTLLPSLASAQCNGVFPANKVCGTVAGGVPTAQSPSAFQGSAGGTNGQVQFNSSGSLGGFTASGDATINTGTGAVAVSKTGGVAFAPSATTDTTNAANISSGTLGLARGGLGASQSAATANQVPVFPGSGGGAVATALTSLINTVCGLSPTTCVSVFGYSNVVWFGATGNGSTDDTTALQACHTTGKTCFYPAGNYKFSTLTMASGGMLGTGPGTSILASTDTSSGNVITYTGTGGLGGPIPLFRDIYIQATGAKAAGALIKLTPSSGILSYAVIDNVVGVGPPITFDLLNCDAYKITNNTMQNWSVAGARITNTVNIDDGDGQISGNFINSGLSTGANVLWNSGGGLRVYGNKLLGGAVGVDIQPTFASGATSDFIIANNSIESTPTAGVRMGRASGTGTVSNIQINANEIAVNAPILIDTSAAFADIVITGNVLGTQGGNSAVAIQLGSAIRFVVTGNDILCQGGTTTSGILAGASSNGGKVGGNLITGCTTTQTLSGTNTSTTF